MAEKILINQGVNKFADIFLEIQDFAWNCYLSGRIELAVRGHMEKAKIYDINSGFPYSMTTVPEPTKETWIKSKEIRKKLLHIF